MKNTAKFTQIIVRIGYVALAVCVFALPYFLSKNIDASANEMKAQWLYIPFYFVVPAGYAALACLDKIMQNVQNENLFDNTIARLLKIIVWCCLYAGVVGVLSFLLVLALHKIVMIYVLLLAFGEMFMSLICYVLKSCFEAGHTIKEENDLTV